MFAIFPNDPFFFIESEHEVDNIILFDKIANFQCAWECVNCVKYIQQLLTLHIDWIAYIEGNTQCTVNVRHALTIFSAAPWPAAWGSGAFIFTYLKCIFINMCTAQGTYG